MIPVLKPDDVPEGHVRRTQTEYFRNDVRNCLRNNLESYWSEEELTEEMKQAIKEEEGKWQKTKM